MSKFLVSALRRNRRAADLQMMYSHATISGNMSCAGDGKPVADIRSARPGSAQAQKDRGLPCRGRSPIGKIDIRSDFEPHMDKFLHVLELAHTLETRYIRLFSFFIPEGEDPASYRDKVMDQLGRFVDAARGSGVMLLHENEKAIYGDIPERCRDILDTMDPTVMRGIYDFSNFVQCGAQNYQFGWNLLRDSIVYFHMKDSVYSNTQASRDMGRQITGNVHRPCGQGNGSATHSLGVGGGRFEGCINEPIWARIRSTGVERLRRGQAVLRCKSLQ